MSRFSILLIEDQIPNSAQVVTVTSQHLPSYTLSIARNITEAIDEPGPIHIILLNASQLVDGDISEKLSSLKTAFSDTPILLLIPDPATNSTDDETALENLILLESSENIFLTEAGLLDLGRRLATLQSGWANGSTQAVPSFSQMLCRAISNDRSELSIQLIGADSRVHAWNKTTETLFGIQREQAVGLLLNELPLPSHNISRLMDILDQAHAVGQPFVIPMYPLTKTDTEWIHVQVYPIYKDPLRHTNEPFTDVCIVGAKVPNVSRLDTEHLYHNQELQILLETNREISRQLELGATLDKVVEQIKFLLHGDNCQIYFLEKDNRTLRPVRAFGPLSETIRSTPLTMGEGIIGQTATLGYASMLNHSGTKTEISYQIEEHLLCAPLTALKGIMGLTIVSRKQMPFQPDDLRLFESLVQQASSAISNARLFEETERNLNELAILYEASLAISTHWDNQDVLNTLIRQMVEALNVSRGFIASWNKEHNRSFIQAEFSKAEADFAKDKLSLDKTFELTDHPVLLTMIKQQRPVFLHLSNPALDKTERLMMERNGCRSRLLMPLKTKGETIDWIELWETQQEHRFTADEVRLGRALASQIAVALQNTHYLKQTRQTLEETTALYRVTSALATLQDPQEIISTVLQEYLQALNLKQGSVIIFDFSTKTGVVKAHIQDDQPIRPPTIDSKDEAVPRKTPYRTLEGQQIPLQNNPVYERLMRTRQPVIIEDTKADWLTASRRTSQKSDMPAVGGWADQEAFAVLIIPIKIQAEVVGVLVVENTRHNHPFLKSAISLGQAMVDQLGIGLRNVELYEAEYRRREQAETLREVSSIVNSSRLDVNEVLERILDQLGRVINYDSTAIHLITGNRRRIIAGRGFPNPADVIGKTFPMSDKNEPGVIAINARQPLVYHNITDIYNNFREPVPSNMQSWMGIPLVAQDKVIGLISIDNGEANVYSQEDVELAVAFANQAAIALENARLHEIEVREIERELSIAQEIQETLLPQSIPQIAGLDIAGRHIPARQVGGDFFHFFSTAPDQLGVAVGDVSGKGIPAALYMAAGITAIDAQVGADIMPGELLNRLNTMLYNRLRENKMNIALLIATFTPLPLQRSDTSKAKEARGSVMTVASAGMIAPIGATKHGCRFLPVSGLPIGTLPTAEQVYLDDVFLLDPFTTIIFVSDGIVEAQNESRELFGFDRLEKTILEVVGRQDAKSVADHILKTTLKFIDQAEQYDDMTVVVVAKT